MVRPSLQARQFIAARQLTTATRFITATLVAGALTLGLSGCDDGGELTIVPESAPSNPTATSETTTSETTTSESTTKSERTTASEAPASVSTPKRSKRARRESTTDTAVTCTNTNLKTTVTSVAEPPKHLLITGTNSGSRPCYVYSAPTIAFDLAKDLTIDVLTDSTPQSVVRLEPGESAYAAVITSKTVKPIGDQSYIATRMGLWFAARSGDENAGPGKSFPLPGEGVYVDETVAQVTYWQQRMDDALLW